LGKPVGLKSRNTAYKVALPSTTMGLAITGNVRSAKEHWELSMMMSCLGIP
jgi:hypothetical protein